MSEGTKKLDLKPLYDNVVIRPLTEEESGTKSASGIIIPDTVNQKEEGKRGIIVAVGPGKWNEDGDKRVPMEVEVGSTVVFQSWREQIKVEGDEYWIVSQSDIQAVISS